MTSNNSNNSSTVASTYTFHNFSPEVGSASVSVCGMNKENQSGHLEDNGGQSGSGSNSGTSSNPSHSPSMQGLHSPHPPETVLLNDVDMGDKSSVSTDSNIGKVCKKFV